MSVNSTATTEQSTERGRTGPGVTTSRHRTTEPPSLSETAQDALDCFEHYAQERPDVVAMCCLGVGFVLGWKMKPW
ncbi:hypothetical protein MFFC18_02220 [Mariniblastus fucicola]|uniref:Uncharacterized protein n=1 Tax=Mariniblastus fucicola TaxID=980251 RepID=A0A5B9P2E7_9BACT|nr:hypothetical protein MFFC18_02220 [Mariniblastus fucicola]